MNQFFELKKFELKVLIEYIWKANSLNLRPNCLTNVSKILLTKLLVGTQGNT